MYFRGCRERCDPAPGFMRMRCLGEYLMGSMRILEWCVFIQWDQEYPLDQYQWT